MHPGQVRLQFSWPPLFFARIAYIDRRFAERSFSFRPAPALPVFRPSLATPRSCTRRADEITDTEPPINTSSKGGCCQSWCYGVGNNLAMQYVGAKCDIL